MPSRLPILLVKLFHAAISAEVGGEDISVEFDRDVTHNDLNSPVAYIFELKQENLCCYYVPGFLFGEILRGQQDVPRGETSHAKVPT